METRGRTTIADASIAAWLNDVSAYVIGIEWANKRGTQRGHSELLINGKAQVTAMRGGARLLPIGKKEHYQARVLLPRRGATAEITHWLDESRKKKRTAVFRQGKPTKLR